MLKISGLLFSLQNTNPKHGNPIYPNLLSFRQYVYMKEGFLYLASIMDPFKIIGFHMGDRLMKELVLTALDIVMKKQLSVNHC